MDSERINGAVQKILAGCFNADDPVAELSVEIEGLRRTGQWSELELRRIQDLAMGTAKALVAR
jgi:hypothetical protein